MQVYAKAKSDEERERKKRGETKKKKKERRVFEFRPEWEAKREEEGFDTLDAVRELVRRLDL